MALTHSTITYAERCYPEMIEVSGQKVSEPLYQIDREIYELEQKYAKMQNEVTRSEVEKLVACSECGEENPETYNVEKSVEDLIQDAKEEGGSE
jgi:formylmethanofuran dehydrogenase subunit E